MRTPPLVAGLVVLLATTVVSGCGQVAKNITKREVVVHFVPDATHAQHVAARAACSDLPHATPEPMPTGNLRLSQRLMDVRFRVDDANDRELLNLYKCLQKQSGVAGIDIPTVQ